MLRGVTGVALHHVSLEVKPDDVERTVEFWGVLGFERLRAPDAIAEYVTWLERGQNQIHLIHTPDPGVPFLGHPAVVSPAGFEETVAALERAGFEFEESRQLWGERRGFATAPGGHKVEVMAAPPPAGTAG
jgi:catechol 2,3-dioxygenase-like lactoylglutathione lyase family enzyme